MSTTFRWMEQKDIEELSALAHRIWNAHYPSIITQEQIDYMLSRSYSPDTLATDMQKGSEFLLALDVMHKIIGFGAIAPLSTIKNDILCGENAEDTDYYLQKFYVAPEYHGQGIAAQLLTELFTRKPEITKLRLQVARKNIKAWKFYQKQGFTIECEADFSIGNDFEMQDYVMEKKINPTA